MSDGAATRRRIMEAIAASPGVHKSQLCRQLGLGWGTVGHHVRILRKDDQLQAKVQGRFLRLYPRDYPADDVRWMSLLHEDVCSDLLERLIAEPDQRMSDLARELGVSRRVVRRQLDLLVAEGVVRSRGEFQRRYQVDAQAARALRSFFPAIEPDGEASEPDLTYWASLLTGDPHRLDRFP